MKAHDYLIKRNKLIKRIEERNSRLINQFYSYSTKTKNNFIQKNSTSNTTSFFLFLSIAIRNDVDRNMLFHKT